VARRSWHVDVGVAVADLDPSLRKVAEHFPRARFLFFGFGDRRYLLTRHRGPATLSGSIWPGAGLLLITALENQPEQAFGDSHVVHISLTDTQQRALMGAIAAAFESNPLDPQFIEPGPYDGSAYAAAGARYSGLHTCNTWAAEVMQRSGLPISSSGVIFASQVWSRVRLLRAQLATP
jgi:hypothetical protein